MELNYIISSQVCFAAMWIFYRLFLYGSGAFSQNRAYLLLSMVVSMAIPLLSLPVYAAKTVIVAPVMVPQEMVYGVVDGGYEFDFKYIMIVVYLIGVFLMLLSATSQSIKLRRMRRGATIVRVDNIRIVYTDRPYVAFSFFNYIFISKDFCDDADIPSVVAHETCHIRLLHSADLIVAQTFLIIFWWNPFAWLWQRSLREVHEFQADSKVLKLGFDSKQYIKLLITSLTGIHPEFVNGFGYSLIKKRLIMISNKKRTAKFRILLVLPMVTALLAVFSFTSRSTPLPQSDAKTAPVSQSQTVQDDEVDEMPLFRGEDCSTFSKWVMGQVIYPKEAIEKKIEGTVTVSFVVKKDGSIGNIEVVKSPDPMFSEQVVRIIKSSPKWTPAKLKGEAKDFQMNLPVIFKLQP